jgi:hypothetical protein
MLRFVSDELFFYADNKVDAYTALKTFFELEVLIHEGYHFDPNDIVIQRLEGGYYFYVSVEDQDFTSRDFDELLVWADVDVYSSLKNGCIIYYRIEKFSKTLKN